MAVRNPEVRGALFWIVASGLVNVGVMLYGFATNFYSTNVGITEGVLELVITAIYFMLVYPCNGEKSWGFVGSMALSAFVVVASFTNGIEDPLSVLFIILGLVTVYFSYLGYLEVKGARSLEMKKVG